jgi:NAD-dependent protein deacetylase/lipoamidase
MSKPTVVVLTGAGISAESGINTFRGADGLWEGHDVMEVASPIGWAKNQNLVLDFYNQRRKQLLEVKPNAAHIDLVKLEAHFDTFVITQNVDDLHERGGSKNITHLHGELLKVRSIGDPRLIYHWEKDLLVGDICEKGYQLRPHIVWFGEAVPALDKAAKLVSIADIVIIIGTSMQVYPAASLVDYAEPETEIYYIDPNPSINWELSTRKKLKVIEEKATSGVNKIVTDLIRSSF